MESSFPFLSLFQTTRKISTNHWTENRRCLLLQDRKMGWKRHWKRFSLDVILICTSKEKEAFTLYTLMLFVYSTFHQFILHDLVAMAHQLSLS